MPTAQDAEDIVSKSSKGRGAHHSKTCPHQPSSAPTYRLHGLVKTAFGPDPFRITSDIGSSHRYLRSCDSQWQVRSHERNWTFCERPRCYSSADNYTRGNKRNRKLKSLETCGSANKTNIPGRHAELGDRVCLGFRPSGKERERTASCVFVSMGGFPSEPGLPTLADISPALRKPAAGGRRTTIGSRYRHVSASTNPVATLNPADASDPFPTGSQPMAKIREERSVVAMDGEGEDGVSMRFH